MRPDDEMNPATLTTTALIANATANPQATAMELELADRLAMAMHEIALLTAEAVRLVGMMS